MTNFKFSLILLSYNERNHIDSCIKSLIQLDYPQQDYELIIVDGLSTDGTKDKIYSWKKKFLNILIIENPEHITPVSMNIGIRIAKGEYIIFLSSHVIYPSSLLIEFENAFNSVIADNVGGILITLPGNNSWLARVIQAISTHRFGVGNSEFRVGQKEGYVDTVVYGCYNRSVFERIGLNDERLVRNQDYELNRRLVKAGGKIWQNPNIQFKYFNQSSIKGFLKQAYSNGNWNPYMWYLAPYAFSLRHAVPLLFVVSLLISTFISFFTKIGIYLLVCILIPYILINLIATFQQINKYSFKIGFVLPVFFFLNHYFYGMGSLVGVFKIIFRTAPIFSKKEPWLGAGRFRAWP